MHRSADDAVPHHAGLWRSLDRVLGPAHPHPKSPDREETSSQRADRNMAELLQELRVGQTGVQLLVGFLLAAAFTPVMTSATTGQRTLYTAALLTGSLAFALLMAPVTVHRLLFARGRKAQIVRVSHLCTIVGMSLLLPAITQAVALATWTVTGSGVAGMLVAGLGLVLALLWFALPVWLGSRTEPDLPASPATLTTMKAELERADAEAWGAPQ